MDDSNKSCGRFILMTGPFSQALNDAIARGRSLSAEGKKIVGYFCTYTPLELIHASGFLPFRVYGGVGPVDRAYSLAPTFICPFMRRVLERALAGDYDFLSGIVQAYTCDVSCGSVNIWRENIGGKICCTMPLPYNRSGDAMDYYSTAARELVEKMNAAGGAFSEESLGGSIDLYDGIRDRIFRLYRSRWRNELPLTAEEFYTVIRAGSVTPPERYLDMLDALHSELENRGKSRRGGLPVLLSGSLVEEPEIFRMIEDCGIRIAADDLCTGFRAFHTGAEEGGSPMERLFHRYSRRMPCPARSRAKERALLILELLKLSEARGVLFLFQKFCTPHLADHPLIAGELEKAGIPSIAVEMEETGVAEGQLKTRLEGFAQMVGD